MSKRIKRRKPVKRQRLGAITLTVQHSRKGEYEYCFVTHDGGKRSEKYFRTEGEAKAALDAKAAEILNAGTRASNEIGDADRRAIMAFRDATRDWPDPRPSVDEALKWFIRERSALANSGTIFEAVTARIADVERRGLSKRHLADLRARLGKFSGTFGTRALRSVTSGEIDHWLHGLEVGAQTRLNFARVVSSVFSLAAERGQIDKNPCDAVRDSKVVRDEVGILKPGKVATLLANCSDEIRAAVAIQAFAGLRRAEVERLDWTAINFDENTITVGAKGAKTASRRVVPMRENLAAWLLPLARPAGFIAPSPQIYRDRLDDARDDAKIDEWPANCLRHSAASYWLAEVEDAAKVAHWLGNSPAMIHGHYKALATKKEAAAYWQIRPAGADGKIIDMKEAAAS